MKTILASGLYLLLIVLIFSATSCKKGDSPQGDSSPGGVVKMLEQGASVEHAVRLLGATAHHQFTSIVSNQVYLGLSGSQVGVAGEHYFIFINNRLESITLALERKLSFVRNNDGSLLGVSFLENPEYRLSQALQGENLIGKLEQKATEHKVQENVDIGLTAAFLLVHFLPKSNKGHSDYADWEKIVSKYNPLEIEIGDSKVVVEDRLGPPQAVETVDGVGMIYYYGSFEGWRRLSPNMRWISIVYKDDAVYRIFSNSFLRWQEVIVPLEKAAQGHLHIK